MKYTQITDARQQFYFLHPICILLHLYIFHILRFSSLQFVIGITSLYAWPNSMTYLHCSGWLRLTL